HRPPDGQFRDRDDPFGLVTDIDEHLVLVHAHDGAVHDLPLVDLGEGGLVIGNQLSVGAFDPDAGLLLHEVVASQAAGKYSQVVSPPRTVARAAAARTGVRHLFRVAMARQFERVSDTGSQRTQRRVGSYFASAQLSPTPTSTASGGSRSYAPHISARTSSR